MGIPECRAGGLIGDGVLIQIILGGTFESAPLDGFFDSDDVVVLQPFNTRKGGRPLHDHPLHLLISLLVKRLGCGVELFAQSGRRWLVAFGNIGLGQRIFDGLTGLLQHLGMLMKHVFDADGCARGFVYLLIGARLKRSELGQ